MKISVCADDGVVDELRRGTGLRLQYVPDAQRGAIVLSPENEQEWEALKEVAQRLHRTLPPHSMRMDDNPRIKSDGHGGGEFDGTRIRNFFLFVSK